MFDFEIAQFLYRLSAINRVFLERAYSAKAYFRAALAVDAYGNYIEDLCRRGQLRELPYVGDKIESCIEEAVASGRVAELENFEKEYGVRDYSLLLGHGISDGMLKRLFVHSVKSADQLPDDPRSSRVLTEEFSPRELDRLTTFKENYEKEKGRYLLAYGKCLGDELISFVGGIKGVDSVGYKSSSGIRQAEEKIKEIDLEYACPSNPDAVFELLEASGRYNKVSLAEGGGIKGLTAFGLPFFILPGRSRVKSLPKKLASSIRGDLHCHTLYSDGIHTVEAMASEAARLGYEYLGITDHSVSERVASGMSEVEALAQVDAIHAYNAEGHKIKLLAGIEVDILLDGRLDYSDDVLSAFDYVIAAVHSGLNQPHSVMLARLRKALSNPYVNILAHPTGRLLGRPGILFSSRQGISVSEEEIVALCVENDVALEINAFPERLDIDSGCARAALELGASVSIGTDSHSLAHLRNMQYGVAIASKANVPEAKILNTMGYEDLLERFACKRRGVRDTTVDKPKSTRRDFAHYFGNIPEIMNGSMTVIGIDLTSKESKPSGWAYLRGPVAECHRVGSDDALVQSVEALNPDVVSIDSPLAYPRGRCCARKDCTCSKFGTMRESERMLRHFGIDVYPCLIDSMVNVTTRGMGLAARLRELGHVVIESYPGAAQDIMQIQRKGKTKEQLEHTKLGLASFGITGDLLEKPSITDDEVDAITSALVGYFYLSNQCFAMGNDDEDYLMVPCVNEVIRDKRCVIGFSGESGAGKTFSGKYLQFKFGFGYFRYSQVIAEKYDVRGKEELQRVGEKIAKDMGEQAALTDYIVDRIGEIGGYAVDGIRHPEDVKRLRERLGSEFCFVYIDSTFHQRKKRYEIMLGDDFSEERFRAMCEHGAEADIVQLKKEADIVIKNNGTYKSFRDKLNTLVEGLSSVD